MVFNKTQSQLSTYKHTTAVDSLQLENLSPQIDFNLLRQITVYNGFPYSSGGPDLVSESASSINDESTEPDIFDGEHAVG